MPRPSQGLRLYPMSRFFTRIMVVLLIPCLVAVEIGAVSFSFSKEMLPSHVSPLVFDAQALGAPANVFLHPQTITARAGILVALGVIAALAAHHFGIHIKSSELLLGTLLLALSVGIAPQGHHSDRQETEDEIEKRLWAGLNSAIPTDETSRSQAAWRSPRPEDRAAIDQIFGLLLNYARGMPQDAVVADLFTVLAGWKTLDQDPEIRRQLRFHLDSLLASSTMMGPVRITQMNGSAEWLRRFFRIYQYAFYFQAQQPRGQEPLILLAPIRRYIPIQWNGFHSVIEVAPRSEDTTITGGFTPLSNAQEVVVVNNQQLKVDPFLAALHEAEHRFLLSEFAKKRKTPTLGDLEFTAYAGTMAEIGRRMEKADGSGIPRHQQRHYLADIFGGEDFLDSYLVGAPHASQESHIEATLRLLPSSLGEILEAMILMTNEQHEATRRALDGFASRVGSASVEGRIIRAMGPTPARNGPLSRDEILRFLQSFSFDEWSRRVAQFGYELFSINRALLDNLLMPVLHFVELNASGSLIRLAAESRYRRYYQATLGYVPQYPNLAEQSWISLSPEESGPVQKKVENPRIAEIRNQIMEELETFYFPNFPDGKVREHWSVHDWRSRSSRCTILGWLLYFVGEDAIDHAFAQHEPMLSPLIPSKIHRDPWIKRSFPEDYQSWKLFALLDGLRKYPKQPFASAAWLNDIIQMALRFENNGEAFRRQAWQDLQKGNDRTAIAYIFIRNRIFNGREYDLQLNGIHLVNHGPESEAESERNNRPMDERVLYEWQDRAAGQRFTQYFYGYGAAQKGRTFFGQDRFDASAYRSGSPLYEKEPDHLQRFYESLFPYMSRPHGPGQGIDRREYGQFSYAWNDVRFDPENIETEQSMWWREDQQKFRDVIDQFAMHGKLPEILESMERLMRQVRQESRLEDKWLMHVAVGTIPYMFAKGYIDTHSDIATTRRALELLFAAVDRHLIPSWSLHPWVIQYGHRTIDILETRIREHKFHADELIGALGHMARVHPAARTVIVTFLIACLDNEKLSSWRKLFLSALKIVFEQEGMVKDPRVVIGSPVSTVDDAIRERYLAVLLKDLEYRKDWGRDPMYGNSRAEDAWEMLGDLGDARAVHPMMHFYETARRVGRIHRDGYRDAEYNPIGKVLARMSALDIARTVLFDPSLYNSWNQWKDRLFSSTHWQAINRELNLKNSSLYKVFLHIFEGHGADSNGPVSINMASTEETPLFDPSISYEQDYYGVLGIEDKRTESSMITSKFRELMRLLHVDAAQYLDDLEFNRLKKVPPRAFDVLPTEREREFVTQWRLDDRFAQENMDETQYIIRGLMGVIDEAAAVLRDPKKRASYDRYSPFGASPDPNRSRPFVFFSAGQLLFLIPIVFGLLWSGSAGVASGHYLVIGGAMWMLTHVWNQRDKILGEKAPHDATPLDGAA